MGSKWWSQGSIRSGVSGISTPNELEYRNKRVEREETGSMVVEVSKRHLDMRVAMNPKLT